MRNKNKFNRKFLVWLAITTMVCSALVSFFLVHENDKEITMLKQEVQNKDALIRDTWDDMGRLERNADNTVIIALLTNDKSGEAEELKKHYLSKLSGMSVENTSLLDLLKGMDAKRGSMGDLIDNTYEQQIQLQEKISNMEHSNLLYSNLAFFMQIISLVLIILTRDIPS